MAKGKVVFDGTPDQLTDEVVRELYGLEAADVVDIPTVVEAKAALEKTRPAIVH